MKASWHWNVATRFIQILKGVTINRPRKIWLRFRGMQIGRSTHVGAIHINFPHQVSIGDQSSIHDDVEFFYCGEGLDYPNIRIGHHCHVGSRTIFNCNLGIELGDHSMVAPGCQFVDCDHTFATRAIPTGQQPGRAERISIGRDVWLGANVIVLRGVTIGEGAVVGAGSVVNKSIGAWEVWAGVPARYIKTRK